MIDVKEYFIKLPNNIVWAYAEGETSILKGMNSKVIMILANLMFRCSPIGICYFTLEDLITECGYTPKSSKGKTNDQFKNILIELSNIGFIVEPNVELNSIRANTLIKCKINSNIATNSDGNDEQFFRLNYKDYMNIITLDTDKDKAIMLNSYCYINSRIWHRPDDYRSESKYSWRNEGKAEYTYFTYDEAVRDLGISENTFKENIDILANNGLIAYGNIGLVNKDGSTRMANNVYVIDLEEFKSAMNDSKYYYESNGYIVLGKKSSEVTKKIIGLSSRINQLNEQGGYDTSVMEKKLNKLENLKEAKNKFETIDKLKEEIQRICLENCDKVLPYTKVWAKKYDTNCTDCKDVNKLIELYNTITKIVKEDKNIIGKPKEMMF